MSGTGWSFVLLIVFCEVAVEGLKLITPNYKISFLTVRHVRGQWQAHIAAEDLPTETALRD
jgi:hypothetical protein